MKLLKKINKGVVLTVIVLLIVIVYIINVEANRNKERPEIAAKCEEYVNILNEHFSMPSEENFLVTSQDTKEDAENIEKNLENAIDNKMEKLRENLKKIMIDNEKVLDMQIDAIRQDTKTMNNAYSGVITSYNKKIVKIDKYEFDGNQVVVTFKAVNEIEEKYVKKGEIDETTQKDKIEIRKDEEKIPSETLTLQKVDGEWKVVYSEIMNVFINSNVGGTVTWETY